VTDLIVKNQQYVFPDPSTPGDGGAPMDAAQIVPLDHGVRINGAPVIEQSHEFVMKKKPDAQD
jgi:hypothetical protein